MLFRQTQDGVLAISQPMHAWIAGQFLRSWRTPLDPHLLLAAEQHDIAWMDWETAPSFDAHHGRPHLFRDVGAAIHAPMWLRGVERAAQCWGLRVALLILRHGGIIYRRYTDRHQLSAADAAAAADYLRHLAETETLWVARLGLDAATLAHDTALIAFADTLSLLLCGELSPPLDLEAPDGDGGMLHIRAEAAGGGVTLAPWPFQNEQIAVTGEALLLPPGGRLADEDAMRQWLGEGHRVAFTAQARKGG
jgi:hypothetical protein